jgi:predicted acyltransferase
MTTASPPLNSSPLATLPRLMSIDAYRGFVMLLMMAEVLKLSDVAKAMPENSFWRLMAWHQTHVPWAGCTLHDLIQPSFSFLVGVALPFSIAARLARGHSKGLMFLHALWRAALLIAIGIVLRSVSMSESLARKAVQEGLPELPPQTYFTFEDTLAQIGLGYVPLFLLGFARERWQWVALVAIVVGYWIAFVVYPLPPQGFDYAAVGVKPDWPYQYHGLAAHWNKNSNLAWAFDRWWLNLFPRHPYLGPFKFYPGGYATLSFIPTLATMILGLIAGNWLKRQWTQLQKVGWLVLTGVILLSLGLIAHETELCPCVKRIWTSSWVLYSGGWCFLLLAGFYLVIDVAQLQTWSFPLRVIGMNSIAAYVLAHGCDRLILYLVQLHLGKSVFLVLGTAFETLVSGGIVLLVLWLILLWMERRRIFIKL